METSAKDGDGVTAAVVAIAALALEQLRESGRLEGRIKEQAAAARLRAQNKGQSGKTGSKIELMGEKYSDNSSNNCC